MSAPLFLPPGSRVLRRGPDHLQIGTDPGVVIADRPGLRELLALVTGTRDIDTLSRLAAQSLPELVDPASTIRELVGRGALVHRIAPPRVVQADVVAADRSARPFAAAVRTLIENDGGRVSVSVHAPLVVVASEEPPRAAFTLARQMERPHLPVVLSERGIRCGPFVIPGLTPCLECFDRHRTDADPAWPALLTQIESAASAPAPVESDVAAQWRAAAAILTDLRVHQGTRRPMFCGAIVTFAGYPDQDERRAVPFHPGCTCLLLPAL